MEVRDALSSELLTTLTGSGVNLVGNPAYSPDGHSLTCLSGDAIVVWDIQTGGVARETEFSTTSLCDLPLMWSLDGGTICTTYIHGLIMERYAMYIHDVASGTTTSPGQLQSRQTPHLWARDESFRIMTTDHDGQAKPAYTIDIFEVGSALTKIESFHIGQFKHLWIQSFSPTTYRISFLDGDYLRILDIRSSECLLEQEGDFMSRCFSSDGNLFAAASQTTIRVWKHTSDRYTPLWQLYLRDPLMGSLLFSPTSSSLLGCSEGILKVWHLDAPTADFLDRRKPLAALSRNATYVATGLSGGSTVTITNLFSQTPSCFIDTGTTITDLALTGNVLLALDSERIAAWLLTREGVVDGVSAGGRADCTNGIWTAPRPFSPRFSVGDQTVVINGAASDGHIYAYHTETGEVLKPAQAPSRGSLHSYSLNGMLLSRHYSAYRMVGWLDTSSRSEGAWPVSWMALQEGWVKDPGGKHRLWIPIEWRTFLGSVGWFDDITTMLRLDLRARTVIIVF